MRSNANPIPGRDNKLSKILLRLGAWITSGPVLIGLPALILAVSLVPALLFFQTEPGLASEIALPTHSSPNSPTAMDHQEQGEPRSTLSYTSTPGPIASALPTRTPSPTPTLPSSAAVEGIQGHRQSMPLSCEARSAVDWASYFGTEIDEGKFFAGLPRSNNPEEGFVGDVYGSWGQIPPDDYGVHAKPIAQRLREYGLKAKHLHQMTLEELKAEIAAGRPVIVWVVGHVNRGTPVPYTSASGETITVAEFEHTVIVTGYTEHKLTVVDGARVYSIYQGEFLKSWNVLENQAVIWLE